MKKILLSVLTVAIVAGVAFGATRAFFSDKETSTGNILAAGALDLKIDNICYYNGNACVDVNQETGVGHWKGSEDQCSCTWKSKDLEEGNVFFDLHDLKPGDWEEDTISIDVDNPSWLCADIKVTRDADNSCTEPEQEDEQGNCDETEGDGELDENLHFVFWEDDGDNVYEDEPILTRGTADNVLGNVKWALADSEHGRPVGGPNADTYYIGKFFCFGDIEVDSENPEGIGGPDVRGSGFTCDGKAVDNQSQTDSLEGDISFYAEQARHNENFLCNPPEPTVTVTPTPTGAGGPTGT